MSDPDSPFDIGAVIHALAISREPLLGPWASFAILLPLMPVFALTIVPVWLYLFRFRPMGE